MEDEVELVDDVDIELSEEQEKELGTFLEPGDHGSKYNYTYVPLQYVINVPDEYIIPECIEACKAFWNKNIETFMVSNYDDNYLYVLIINLSKENEEIVKKMLDQDSRYFYDAYRDTYGIKVNGMSKGDSFELLTLTDVFKMQDTTRYQSEEEFLSEYKRTGGEMYVDDEGRILTKVNPSLKDATINDALDALNCRNLYIQEERRIYENELFLSWHLKYIKYKMNIVKNYLVNLKENNINSNISYVRDVFLEAESDYLKKILQDYNAREYIKSLNKFSSDALIDAAIKLMNNIDSGVYSKDELEKIEKDIILYLAAIIDKKDAKSKIK